MEENMENEVLQENAVEEKVEQTAQEKVVAKKPVKPWKKPEIEKGTVSQKKREKPAEMENSLALP